MLDYEKLKCELVEVEYELHQNKRAIERIIDYRFGGKTPPDALSKKLPKAVEKLDNPTRWISTVKEGGERSRKLRRQRDEIKTILRERKILESGQKVSKV